MLNLLAQPALEPRPQPYAEAVSRLASLRHALRLVEPCGGGPAPDVENDDQHIVDVWDSTGPAKRHCFDRRSERVVAATGAGLDALLAEREAGRTPNEAAHQRLADEIRAGLEDVSTLMLGGRRAGAQFPRLDSLPFAL